MGSRSTRRVLELLGLQRYEGSGVEFISDPALNKPMGAGEQVLVHTSVMRVGSGTSATMTLSLTAEDSADGVNWSQVGSTPFINGTNINWDDTPVAIRGVVEFPHARFLRIKMALGGANPTAWIQVKATVKPYGGA